MRRGVLFLIYSRYEIDYDKYLHLSGSYRRWKSLCGQDSDYSRTAEGEQRAVFSIASAAVWIFEFKLNGTSKAAMKQIHEKRYYEKYLASGKEIKLIGVAFSKKTRNIGKWIVGEMEIRNK